MAPNLRQQQKLQTRAAIIDAAMGLYGREGWTKARTADVAREAKVSHGTIFVHFATQEELQLAVMEAFTNRMAFRLHELAKGAEQLEGMLKAHLEGLAEHEELYTWLVMENRLLPDQVRHSYLSIQSVISHHIGQAALLAMERGEVVRRPVHLLFNGWLGMIHHYLMNRDLFTPGGSVLEQHGPELCSYYMGLLRPERQ